jgi:osmotically-inducible protein OsmY
MRYSEILRKLRGKNGLTVVMSFLLILVLGATSGCASGPPSYRQNIQSAIAGNGSVWVEIRDDGTVVLSGWVEDRFSKQSVLRAARKGDSVTRVIDRIYLRRS